MTTQKQSDEKSFDVVYRSPQCAQMAISISRRGRITMNRRLSDNLKQRRIRLLLSSDKRTIVMDEKGEPTFTMPLNGSTKALELTRQLISGGITLPARFVMEYNEQERLWTGQYLPRLKIPDVTALAKKHSHIASEKRIPLI